MTLLTFLRALPEIIRLIQAIGYRMDLQVDDPKRAKQKETKEKIDKIAKAIKENDEKALNDVFNSM